jgi:hypothetical protein
VCGVLRRVAPSWLAQLPAVVEPMDQEALRAVLASTSRPRMLREMADALLVLVLDHLHWSDRFNCPAVGNPRRNRRKSRRFRGDGRTPRAQDQRFRAESKPTADGPALAVSSGASIPCFERPYSRSCCCWPSARTLRSFAGAGATLLAPPWPSAMSGSRAVARSRA